MENNKKTFFTVFFLIIFFLAGFLLIKNEHQGSRASTWKPDSQVNIRYVKIAGQTIKVDLATTLTKQAQGLSGRSELKENEGMLFVFAKSGTYHFWMKDMKFSIDIIWISKDLKVVYIKKNIQPESYPETYGPGSSLESALYVLEVTSGFSEKNNLKTGDTIKFVY